jgi:hypothetical protein
VRYKDTFIPGLQLTNEDPFGSERLMSRDDDRSACIGCFVKISLFLTFNKHLTITTNRLSERVIKDLTTKQKALKTILSY